MKRKIMPALFALALTAGAAAAPVGAMAAITTQCSNNGGQLPPGQQSTCNGGGLTDSSVNPQGFAPPGQNK